MIPLLLILVVTSTGLANRQSSDGIGVATSHGKPQELFHMASQGHTPVDITCEHKSVAVCLFISSVAPSSVMETRGGPDWCGKDMDRSLSITAIDDIMNIFCLVIHVVISVMICYFLSICISSRRTSEIRTSEIRTSGLYPELYTSVRHTHTFFKRQPRRRTSKRRSSELRSSGKRPSVLCTFVIRMQCDISDLIGVNVMHMEAGVSTESDLVAWTHCTAYLVGVATPCIVTAMYSRFDTWWRQPIRIEDTRNLIETDEYAYKYPVFLSASSYMDDAELRQLSMALERQLQISCRTDRQLVCSRDNIKPGRRIFLETTNLLEKSGLMVIVISDRYSECEWCAADYEQAFMLHKPILVIEYGDVGQKTVNRILRDIKPKYRITVVDECAITPDWESVCNLILQLLPCRLDSNKALLLLHSLLRSVKKLFNVIKLTFSAALDLMNY